MIGTHEVPASVPRRRQFGFVLVSCMLESGVHQINGQKRSISSFRFCAGNA